MLSRNKVGNVYLKHLLNDTSAFVQRICASVINLVLKKPPPLTLDRNISIGIKKHIYKSKLDYKVEYMEKH